MLRRGHRSAIRPTSGPTCRARDAVHARRGRCARPSPHVSHRGRRPATGRCTPDRRSRLRVGKAAPSWAEPALAWRARIAPCRALAPSEPVTPDPPYLVDDAKPERGDYRPWADLLRRTLRVLLRPFGAQSRRSPGRRDGRRAVARRGARRAQPSARGRRRGEDATTSVPLHEQALTRLGTCTDPPFV